MKLVGNQYQVNKKLFRLIDDYKLLNNQHIAAFYDLITNRVRIKVTIVCTDAYSKIQTVQLQRLQETICIH